MADFDHSDFGGAYDAPVRSTLSTVLSWIGAALSLALIAGLGYWAYQLVVRDVTGVPVVRALEGPMRIAPEDPGGSTAAYQGLAVNAIAAEGTAEAPADLVVLAPVEVNLTEEDRAMSALLPDAPAAPIAEVAAQPLSAIDLAVAAALGESPDVLLASMPVEAAPVEATPAVALAEVEEEPVAPAVAATDAKGMVAVSPRPAPRPARAEGTQVASLDPAYPTEDIAREEWDIVAARFADFMQGKGRVIEQAEAGGRIFYRLRVSGFEDLADSRRFCAVLVAGEASCIPVAAR